MLRVCDIVLCLAGGWLKLALSFLVLGFPLGNLGRLLQIFDGPLEGIGTSCDLQVEFPFHNDSQVVEVPFHVGVHIGSISHQFHKECASEIDSKVILMGHEIVKLL